MSIYEAVSAALNEADWNADFDQAAEQVLSIIGSDQDLLALTRQAVRECAETHPIAYMHSNGFLKIEYFRGRHTGFRVRGHFWNPAWGIARQNPHNHAFDFRSRVVLGAFDHRHFATTSEGDGLFHYGYRYSRAMRSGVDQYSLEAIEPAWLKKLGSEVVPAGDDYRMIGDQLHALDPVGEGLGATVLVSQPYNDRPWSEVYSLNQALDRTPRNAKLLSAATMVECVESVIAARSA